MPSEVARLAVPMPNRFGVEMDRLDSLARDVSREEVESPLIEETDLLLIKSDIGVTPELVDLLRSARESPLKKAIGAKREFLTPS